MPALLSWWSERGVLLENATADDYAPVNQGQLKNIAKAAVAEMDAKLSGGAGDELHLLVESWSSSELSTNDFAPVNLGQLKTVAKPFWDQLISVQYATGHPWADITSPDDFAVANVGQVKNLFSFDLTATDESRDTDADQLPDWWEKFHFENITATAGDDPDADGASNLQELLNGTDPNDRYNGQPPALSVELEPALLDARLQSFQSQRKSLTLRNRTAHAINYSVAVQNNVASGYQFRDSKNGNFPFFWEDISETGTRLEVISNADDDYEEVPLNGFSFPFYGQSYSSVYVGSNGYVTLGAGNDSYFNLALPSLSAPRSLIAAFWDDLSPQLGGDIYFQERSGQLIVQFDKMSRWGDGVFTFQIILFADGTIEFRYLVVGGESTLYTVGLQDSSGMQGVQVSNDAPYVQNNLAVRFTPGTEFVRVTPLQGTVSPNSETELAATFYSLNLPPGIHAANISVAHDGAGDTPLYAPAVLEVVNVPSSIYFTNPTDGFVGWEGKPLSLSALANQPDRAISRVEFYSGSVLLGDGTSSGVGQYSFNLAAIPAGQNIISVRAIDQSGQAFLANSITVTGKPDIDLDGDGLSGSQEEAAGTSESNADTDGDGLTDSAEAAFGTNPSKADTDEDTVHDKADGWPLHKQISTARVPERRYVAIKLGPGEAYSVNNLGEVVGQSRNAQGHNQAVLWRAGDDPIFLDFITTDPLDQLASAAHAINDAGIIAGYSRYSWDPNVTGQYPDPPIYPFLRNDVYGGSGATDTHACLWRIVRPTAGSNVPLQVTAPQDLNDLSLGTPANPDLPDPANKGRSFAFDINQAGTAVGFSTSRVTTGKFVFYWLIGADLDRAVRFNASGAPAQLQMPTHPERPSYATALSGHSIAGSGAGEQGRSAFLFSNGTLQLIDAGGEFLGLQNYASVHGLNIHDHIVGNFGTYGSAAIWVNESNLPANERFVNLTTVPELDDGDNVNVAKINDHDQVVGSAELSQGTEAILWQNGKAFRLNQLIGSLPIGHRLVSATAISRNGLITANTNNGDAYLLLPVELTPDYNRDGIIDDNDRGKVSEEVPWHFWYNEDNDSGETGGDDIPLGSGQGDFGGGTVSGIRDLVDFFAVFLDIKELVKVLPPESNIYKLKAEGGAFKFVYTDLAPADSGKYLKDIAAAEVLKAADKTLVGAGSSAALDPAFLNKIKDEGKGVLLIEAGSKTDKGMMLEVYKGSVKLTELKLYVKTDSVEKMFRHRNLLAANGQSGGRGDELGEPPNYPDRLSSDKTFVFVHGYNVNPEQARGWNCEMFKRLFWSGSKAKFYGVTWYGSETQIAFANVATDYQANVDNAFATAQSLAQFIDGLGGNVTIAAHSLGNMLVGSAMHDWQAAGISNYFMVDAAVPKEAYDSAEEQLATQTTWGMDHPDWSNYPRRLWCSDWHKLFPGSDNRSRLTWKNRLQGISNVFNFYSTGEEVLANPADAPTVPTSSTEVWNNQERMKGRMETGQVLSSNYGGWRFTNYYNEGQVYYPQIPPAQTASITDAELNQQPFFWPGPAELHGANGNNYASPQQHRNTLLSEMVPALSFAAGANPVIRFGTRNVNMPDHFKNDWPRANPSWQHSDAKVVGYLYIYKVFDAVVSEAGLKQ